MKDINCPERQLAYFVQDKDWVMQTRNDASKSCRSNHTTLQCCLRMFVTWNYGFGKHRLVEICWKRRNFWP